MLGPKTTGTVTYSGISVFDAGLRILPLDAFTCMLFIPSASNTVNPKLPLPSLITVSEDTPLMNNWTLNPGSVVPENGYTSEAVCPLKPLSTGAGNT